MRPLGPLQTIRPIMRPPFAFFVFCLLASLAHTPTAAAQPVSVTFGGGIGANQSEELSGRGYHLQLSTAVLPLSRLLGWSNDVQIRLGGMAQWGDLSGGPAACEMVPVERPETFCFGRSESNRLLGADLALRVGLAPRFDPVRLYLLPVGFGLYHRRTAASETAPLPDEQYERFTEEVAALSPGWTIGAGLRVPLGPASAFAEGRVYDLFEGAESIAGAVVLTVGLVLERRDD